MHKKFQSFTSGLWEVRDNCSTEKTATELQTFLAKNSHGGILPFPFFICFTPINQKCLTLKKLASNQSEQTNCFCYLKRTSF